MQLSEWSVLLLLLKLASYIAIVGLAGTLLMRFMCGNSNVTCVVTGSIAALLQGPIEAGAMAESGFMGMFDPFMLEIVWQSVIGDQARFRIPALIIALISACMWNVESDDNVAGYKNGAVILI